MAFGTNWSRDTIAMDILRLYVDGEPLSYSAVQQNHHRLLRAASRYFGSWQAAIEFAGLDYSKIRRYRSWTNDAIVEKIQEYHRDGKDLSWRYVSLELDPPLAAAAIRANRFGSWEAAIQAAGLSYDEIRLRRAWDPETVLEELRHRQAAGESLRVSDATGDDPALVAAARRHFDGWYEAIVAAGIDEMEARLGLRDEYDEEFARGEISWSETREATQTG
jgi:hypothetical protein